MKNQFFEIFKYTKEFEEKWNKFLHLDTLPHITAALHFGGSNNNVSDELANLFLTLRNKFFISKSIIFRLFNVFSNSYGLLVPLDLKRDWLEPYVFPKIGSFVDVFIILTDIKLFNVHMFGSLLRDMYLFVLQITKILSSDDELLKKYLYNKKNKYIFSCRKRDDDFKKTFEKISNEINKLNDSDIVKQQYKEIKYILKDDFIEHLCDYVHHNHFCNDYPHFLPFANCDIKWAKETLIFFIKAFKHIFILFLIVVYLFNQSSFANISSYVNEAEETGSWPTTDLNIEAQRNFKMFIEVMCKDSF